MVGRPSGAELRQEGTMASSQSPGFLLMSNGFELEPNNP